MRIAGQRLSIVGSRKLGKKADRHADRSAISEDAPEIGQAPLATVPADDVGMFAEVDCDRAYGDPCRRRCDDFKQARPEFEETAPAARCPLRKDGQWLVMRQRFGDPPHLLMRFM